MRLFVGIPLSVDATAELAALQRTFSASARGLRWSSPQSWHITLQFLGSLENEQLAYLKARLAEVHAAPVAVQVGSPGVFDRAGVFHVEITPNAQLLTLQKRILAATAQCGFVADERPYRPHITLARIQGDQGRRTLRDLKSRTTTHRIVPSFLAREFLLYESHLGPGGSKYEVRERYTLR
jgi:2'-5' RNA ligase